MCGIVGASAQRNVEPILLEGLRRLEYRGYDSAGMALVNDGALDRTRAVGKVQALADKLAEAPRPGVLGIAHTRWATHGGVSETNAHPHVSSSRIAVVHNGIIENFEPLRERLREAGYEFTSQTDTEVVAHLIDSHLGDSGDLATAVRTTVDELDGAYALAVVCRDDPHTLVATRSGSPLVLGVGIGEHFVASDVAALLPVTRDFIYLEEGDLVVLTHERYTIIDGSGAEVDRPVKESGLSLSATEKGSYRHFMLKEIYEQPRALAETWQGRVSADDIFASSISAEARELLDGVEYIHIVACGTSHHAGLVARYWLEAMARIPCNVELASEYRYRDPVVPKNCLFVTLSQSGETADTLAALRYAKSLGTGDGGYLATLAICNKPESSLTRESDLVLMTHAGPEIGVASTKAFTTQLLCLLLLTGMLERSADDRRALAEEIHQLATSVERVLELDNAIRHLAEEFVDKDHALFLGRGPMYPIAMEGALKLKEISYLHAEAYAAGELKHGPLALVDEKMPVIAIAPKNDWLEKVKSNLQEVRARGGKLYVFADAASGLDTGPGITVLDMPHVDETLAPIAYTVPLQLLAYHVAVAKGTDVDQPRNLAKSVTVE
ncbi:Glutamine--fructose-6-phosphate aminotransferase isomerizing protein [Salinisphaera shabanensis E1L3A]|uniref:Glutamine--fructose-6-phosphate aminotransferase [isomerizing] n=2 Tax=Salinisphaera TaxID=180541 RepID=U2E4G0_9GAMM|nr:glutamine--fructose-6-phosphate transaminase (isomerizing) [Salinisphaera shabanensis]ERJ18736.1 Glutamine--fructose-6-phosphate aminotransferase isomerizing protein [Salinisphaera shabanensis E1L3A]